MSGDLPQRMRGPALQPRPERDPRGTSLTELGEMSGELPAELFGG